MGTQMGKGKAKESEQARASRLKETRIWWGRLPFPIKPSGKSGREREKRRAKRSKENQKAPQPQRKGKRRTMEVTENIREARLNHENLLNIFLAFFYSY